MVSPAMVGHHATSNSTPAPRRNPDHDTPAMGTTSGDDGASCWHWCSRSPADHPRLAPWQAALAGGTDASGIDRNAAGDASTTRKRQRRPEAAL